MHSLTSDAMATREEALHELEALAHDVAAVAALARSGRAAVDVMAAWASVRDAAHLLPVTAALARWRTLETVVLQQQAAGGAQDV